MPSRLAASALRLGSLLSAQLIVSATSLTLSFLLMHVMSVEAYAKYVLMSAVALFASGLFTATFVSRFAAGLGSSSTNTEQAKVREAIGVAANVACAIVLVGVVASGFAAEWSAALVWMYCGLTLFRDGALRTANAAGRKRTAIFVAATSSALALAGVITPLALRHRLAFTSALMVLDAALLVAGLVTLRGEGLSLATLRRGTSAALAWARRLATLRDWLGAGYVAIWLQAQAVLFLAERFVGSTGVAALGAARIYVSPLVFLSQALAPVAIARCAANTKEGQSRRYVSITAAFAALYVVLMVPAAALASPVLFPNAIQVSYSILIASTLFGAVQFTKDSIRYVAIAYGMDKQMWNSVLSGLIVSAGCSASIAAMGWASTEAFLGAFATGEAVSAILLFREVMTRQREVWS